MESCLGEEIPPIVQLEECMRNGVILARLARVFAPDLVPRIFEAAKLQFRHSDNINRFFRFVERCGLPEVPSPPPLYTYLLCAAILLRTHRFVRQEKHTQSDLLHPRLIVSRPPSYYFIYLRSSYILSSTGQASPINDLVGLLEFTEDELLKAQKGLDAAGITLPNFKNVSKELAK